MNMTPQGSKIEQSDKQVRHIVALSGGKDSSALAVYMRGKIPNVEYVFCDTGEELDETYE
jgi:3'-phosphoadenosine 5'-phosphosulfate sulfotransferase (PAPS reductase)/FAD synthetase